jgi:hypothetical protein
MPTGSSALDAAGRGLQRLAQADDVAALGHRHAQRDDGRPWWRTITAGGST